MLSPETGAAVYSPLRNHFTHIKEKKKKTAKKVTVGHYKNCKGVHE
jgi:hypothetical protein